MTDIHGDYVDEHEAYLIEIYQAERALADDLADILSDILADGNVRAIHALRAQQALDRREARGL